jgi:hypothetical protein
MGSIGLVMQEMVKAEHQLLDYQIRSRGLDLKLSGDLLCKSVGALTRFCLPAEKYRAGRCVDGGLHERTRWLGKCGSVRYLA